jgi:flagellum-specific ATP synthase
LAAHREVYDLLAIGAYKKGSIPRLDDALERMPQLEAFLRQSSAETPTFEETERQLQAIWKDKL